MHIFRVTGSKYVYHTAHQLLSYALQLTVRTVSRLCSRHRINTNISRNPKKTNMHEYTGI